MDIHAVDLERTFLTRGGIMNGQRVRALRGVTLDIPSGSVLSIVGESGCGKTTLGRILAGLERFDSGELRFDATSIRTASPTVRAQLFRKVQLIQQDPSSSLNPMRTLRQALLEPLHLRARELGKPEGWIAARALSLLRLVGLDPSETLDKYPHALSGGQRQRFVIARALSVDPEVLVADEAVSMIDVSLRLGILRLFRELNRDLGLTIIFITHDVAAARYISRDGRLCVLYRGAVVELGPCDTIIRKPLHPYTQALLSAIPVIRGMEVPGPDRWTPDEDLAETQDDRARCVFAGRCPFATEECRRATPPLVPVDGEPGHFHACLFPEARQVTPQPVVESPP